GMGGRVRFAGEQDEAFDWMAAADLVAMTSLYEGHALVPLEAMLCGRPVLAMKVDGVEDSVEDGVTGILIRPGDTGAFAARLAELARDPGLRRRLGDEAEARVDRWDWQKSLLQYRNLLDALGPVR
ncbi:MAG: glycosyltransferase, partial [Verrucomicrobia bacterium]|nr:glycosyltransferase [Verrucomicrobiota bacterium]